MRVVHPTLTAGDSSACSEINHREMSLILAPGVGTQVGWVGRSVATADAGCTCASRWDGELWQALTLSIHHAGDARRLRATPIYECFVALITSRSAVGSICTAWRLLGQLILSAVIWWMNEMRHKVAPGDGNGNGDPWWLLCISFVKECIECRL